MALVPPPLRSFFRRYRRLLVVGAAILVALFIAECRSILKAPLHLMVWGNAAEKEALANRLAVFSMSHQGLRVKLTVHSTQQECRSKFLFHSRRGDPPDVGLISAQDLAFWVDGGHVCDLSADRLETEAFVPQVVAAFSRDTRLYAVPAGWSVLMLYYNRAVFERHGVPPPKPAWDWGDLLTAAQALTVTDQDRGKIIQYGIEAGPTAATWIPFLWQNRGQIFRDDGSCSLMDPQFAQSNLKAIEFYADLVREHAVAPPINQSRTVAEAGRRFVQQKAAMVLAPREFAAGLHDQAAFDWDIALLPSGSQAASWFDACGYAISPKSQHPAQARELLAFLTSETTQATLALAGRWAPPRKSLLASPIFRDYPGPRAIHNQLMVDALAVARGPPLVMDWDTSAAILTDEMSLLMSNPKIPARQILERMQARLDEMNLLRVQRKR